MNSTRRDFFKVAGAAAAVGALASRDALAHAPKPKPGNNPIWLMTSAFPGDDFAGVVKRALEVGRAFASPLAPTTTSSAATSRKSTRTTS